MQIMVYETTKERIITMYKKHICINYYKTGLVILVKYAKIFHIKFYYSLKIKYFQR